MSDTTAPKPPSPEGVVSKALFGGLLLRCLVIAAELGIADRLAAQPCTTEELAASTGTHAPSLFRVLRALAGAGVFAQRADGRFELTPAGSLLRSEGAESMRDFVLMFGESWMWQAWGDLLHTVKTGECAHEHVQGMRQFDYLRTHPHAGTIFNHAMSNDSRRAAPAIAAAYDFSRMRRVVDIGGGEGHLISGVLRANPHLRGVLFDLPAVVAAAGALRALPDVGNRIELAPGDFFNEMPPGADAYMLKSIIHDWDDARATDLLSNVRRAMSADGRVLIVEMIIPERGDRPHPAKLLDIMMLAMTTGKERTEAEYREIMRAAGFNVSNVISTRSPYTILEGTMA